MTLVASRSDIPAIDAQPTLRGRQIGIGAATDDGALLTYGDYSNGPNGNSGPVDLIQITPDGEIVTLLDNLPSERIDKFVEVDGSLVSPSIDPKGAAEAFLISDEGGDWQARTVRIEGYPTPTHLFDVTAESGLRYICGSRRPIGTGGSNGDGSEGVAIVWATEDGSTWTESLAFAGDDEFNRFYEFCRVDGRLAVQTTTGGGYFVLSPSGDWESNADATRDVAELPLVRVAPDGEVRHRLRGDLGRVEGLPLNWTSQQSPDGTIWLSDGEHVYLLPA